MNHFEDYYNENKPNIHETDVSATLEILNKYISSVGEEDSDYLSKVSSFLDSNELKIFINDSLMNYVYKKVFNMALLLFKNNEKEYIEDATLFFEDFKLEFKELYTFHYQNEDNFETLAKEIYKLVQSPTKSRTKITKKLRKYSEENEINNCYLCGDEVNFETDKNISLNDAWNANIEKNKIKKHQLEIKSILLEDTNELENIEEEYRKKTVLNNLNSIFRKSDFKLNSKKCEIEHNFPAGWGGDLSSSNIFVACHRCNNDKGDIAFYTDIDYSNIFSNSKKIENIRRDITAKTKIAIKIKQNFSCKNESCTNKLGENMRFFLINENPKQGITFFNLSMYCEDCIENRYAVSKKMGKEEYIKEYCIHLN